MPHRRPGSIASTSAPPAPRRWLTRLSAYILASALPDHVRERGAATVERFMMGIGQAVIVERRDKPSLGPGAAVVIVAECEGGLAGFTAIGKRGKPMELVAG